MKRMKSKKSIVIAIIILSGIAVFGYSYLNQKKAKKPVDRYYEAMEKTPSPSQGETTVVPDVTGESAATPSGSVTGNPPETAGRIIYEDWQYDILAYEIIKDTDMVEQTKYPMKNFAGGESFDPMFLRDMINFESLKEASPEYAHMLEHLDDYSYEERERITEENRELIEKYTERKHPDTSYVFIRVRATDVKNYENIEEEDLPEYRTLTPAGLSVVAFSDAGEVSIKSSVVYFETENEINPNDAEGLSVCRLERGAYIEYTIGIQEEINGNITESYYGIPDFDLWTDEKGEGLKRSKYLVALNGLPGIE